MMILVQTSLKSGLKVALLIALNIDLFGQSQEKEKQVFLIKCIISKLQIHNIQNINTD